jgi:hypothetical protein
MQGTVVGEIYAMYVLNIPENTEYCNLSAFVLQRVIILVSMSNEIPTDIPHLPKYEMRFTFSIILRKMGGCFTITHKFKKFKHVLYIYFLENSRL